MTSQILDCLWIDSSMDQVGNIGVTQLMGCYLEIQTVDVVFPVHAFLTGLRLPVFLSLWDYPGSGWGSPTLL